ncbi:HET-domain-containing protein [Leucogyrophana mollusca]|uniref:HET-domain-containing protein n=1 Tax=Leucogyrophana mollusca TaxID=85980 RepID=A0ACB8BJS6_9AGAM|nr:HET-domain-containing protein [Leucogyrophana mollusca]
MASRHVNPIGTVVQHILESRISSVPLRLINVEDGMLYSSSTFEESFKASRDYAQLIQADISRSSDAATTVVDSYFSYAMLSHRWGDGEPTLQSINGTSIYSLAPSIGVHKLQGFCRTAKALGFRWAWSDTCCIDKTNSSELQESIMTMFDWYRNSTITLIYLSDVADRSPGALRRSQWFFRGWTLQELLAPHVVLFYLSDWSLYVPRSRPVLRGDNDKTNPELMQMLTIATGIHGQFLTDFKPGVDHLRERFRWVSRRTTRKVEDMAYCMMGIFGVHFPVLYGEKERAFTRLQEEIMKLTDDTNLFDWVGRPSKLNSCLASHPGCFAEAAASLIPLESSTPKVTLKNSVTVLQVLLRGATARAFFLFAGLPPGRFIAGGKLTMFAKRHYIHKIVLESSLEGSFAGSRRYTLCAEGLKDITIVTEEKLVEREWKDHHQYMLAHLDTSAFPGDTDSESSKARTKAVSTWTSMAESAGWFKQPFVALLLEISDSPLLSDSPSATDGPFSTSIYRRVPTLSRIVAYPQRKVYWSPSHPSLLMVG